MSFKKIFDAAKQGREEQDNELNTTTPPNSYPSSSETDLPDPSPRRKPRPLGKRSNPEYVQALSYVPEELYLRVRQKLLDPVHRKKDFSDLVAELLSQWLEPDK